MKKSISITFTFDFATKLSPFNLFDIGTEKNCFDHQQTVEDFTKRYNQTFQSQLSSIVSACNKDQPLSIYLSTDFTQLLEQVDPEQMAAVKNVAATNHLVILGGLDRSNLSSIYSERQFVRSILSHREMMKSTFGVETATFYNTENIFFTRVGNILLENGFKATFAGAIEWYLGSNLHQRVFHLPEEDQFKVLLIDGDQTKALFHIPEIQQHFLHFCSGQITKLEGVDSIISKTASQGKLIPMDKQIKASKAITPYNIKNPAMGSTQKLMLDSFNGNALQNQVLKQYYQLEETVESTRDQEIVTIWDKLGHSEYLHMMNVNETDSKQPYTIYNQLNNILTDLKLKLEDD